MYLGSLEFLQSKGDCPTPRCVKFQLNQLKIENLAGYFKDQVIDLTPPFQRGRVWTLKMRQSLLKNILQGKPVPAIFMYKTRVGAKHDYVILDGKQRLESILLYIGNHRPELCIPNWIDYIFGKPDRKQVHFKAPIDGEQKNLTELSDTEAAKFRDYSLSIIEIDFDEDVTLAEIIQLFVDINQSGVKVTRFDIVKALYLEDPLLDQIFDLIAEEQERGQDSFFKIRSGPYTQVLKQLDIVKRIGDSQNKIDTMWERLCEFAMFASNGQHRKPSQILKDFISRKGTKPSAPKLTKKELGLLRGVFTFLRGAYKNGQFCKTKWATDQTHFYILTTSLLNEAHQNPSFPDDTIAKLIKFDALMANKGKPDATPTIRSKVKDYMALSEKQTTDVAKRQEREKLFRELLGLL